MDMIAEAKSMRLLTIYTRLLDGQTLKKGDLAHEFGITQRSVQRDIESLRIFLAEEMMGREITYDTKAKGYRLVNAAFNSLSKNEILAVCKILLESRSMRQDEMMPILDKLLDCCVADSDRKDVTRLIANERFHYIEPQHKKPILDGLWELGQAVEHHRVIEVEYQKLDGTPVKRTVEPLGIMFSEFYFYLIAIVRNEPYTSYFKSKNRLMPAIYRIDRLQRISITNEIFTPVYANRFQEGEFRKRIQFMFGGKLERKRFRYVGPSLEAVLDRLPTAKIIAQDDEGWLIEAEVYGKGIDMWLRSQGEYIKYQLQEENLCLTLEPRKKP